MNFRIKGAMRKSKVPLIISIILWFFLIIVFVVPFSFSLYAVTLKGGFDFAVFGKAFTTAMSDQLKVISVMFGRGEGGRIISTFFIFTILYWIVFFIGFVRSVPKHEYEDIEHGSSDWSKHGEQYEILNKNKGIILAENNYLPVDKRGNVNVLVVGRIRFW